MYVRQLKKNEKRNAKQNYCMLTGCGKHGHKTHQSKKCKWHKLYPTLKGKALTDVIMAELNHTDPSIQNSVSSLCDNDYSKKT